MSYASIAQFVERFDSRMVAQLSNDDNSEVRRDSVVQAALDDASSDIDSAALVGSQYTTTQLQTLADANDNTIVRLTCFLAYRYMIERRGQTIPDAMQRRFEEADKLLKQLREGSMVFDVAANRDGDVPATVTLSEDDINNLGLVSRSDFFAGLGRKTRTVDG